MAGSDRRATVEEVLAEFDGKRETLSSLCAKTKGLIEVILQDAGIQYQSVQARVKTPNKLRSKYLDPEKQYRSLKDNLAGLRVITYYEDDVDRVAEVIKGEFEVDAANSVDKREVEPDRFGYSAINLVCTHLAKRTADVEYKKFSGIPCEIQVTSILSHAWSEMEHEWYDLKESYPDEIKRRFSRLVALFELADQEFLEIRKARVQYERSVAVRVEARVPDIPIDAVSLKSFIEQEPTVLELDQHMSSLRRVPLIAQASDQTLDLRARVLKLAGMNTLQQLTTSLEKHKGAVREYMDRCKKENVWAPFRGSALQRAISLHHLAVFLKGLQSPEAIAELHRALGNMPKSDLVRQSAIAKEVAAKYGVGLGSSG